MRKNLTTTLLAALGALVLAPIAMAAPMDGICYEPRGANAELLQKVLELKMHIPALKQNFQQEKTKAFAATAGQAIEKMGDMDPANPEFIATLRTARADAQGKLNSAEVDLEIVQAKADLVVYEQLLEKQLPGAMAAVDADEARVGDPAWAYIGDFKDFLGKDQLTQKNCDYGH